MRGQLTRGPIEIRAHLSSALVVSLSNHEGAWLEALRWLLQRLESRGRASEFVSAIDIRESTWSSALSWFDRLTMNRPGIAGGSNS